MAMCANSTPSAAYGAIVKRTHTYHGYALVNQLADLTKAYPSVQMWYQPWSDSWEPTSLPAGSQENRWFLAEPRLCDQALS